MGNMNGFIQAFPYAVVRNLGMRSTDRVVAYFDSYERAEDYVSYLNTVKKDYENFLLKKVG